MRIPCTDKLNYLQMKNVFLICVAFVLAILMQSCDKPTPATPEALSRYDQLLPKPVALSTGVNAFFITEKTPVVISESGLQGVADYLVTRLRPATGFALAASEGDSTKAHDGIFLSITNNAALGDEGYQLSVTEHGITIAANKPAGVFYGIQTLCQLLPAAVDATTAQQIKWEVATGQVTDYPTYAWRGSMLDVARHFFGVDDVKRYIDLMSRYKMNVMHLGLTNDQGWRIEIKSWPRLATHGGSTEVGGGEGGYYTQEQYKDIVAYAQQRYVTIVPEIDMPGHINAALASYGELNGGITIVPEAGSIKPQLSSGVLTKESQPTALYTGTEVGFSTLQLNKEATFRFVNDVLRELAAITPGPYLHVGGDEAAVTKKDDYITFVNRFQEIVEANGKKMIGWEEVAQGNINDKSVAQYWHSEKYALMAAEKGAKVLMSPSTRVYLDMQYDSTTKLGLHWAAYIEVKDAYDWDPAALVNGLEQESIIGVEAPLWTETIEKMDDIEYMIFPRLPAVAEVAWTSRQDRNWDTFKTRLAQQAPRWKLMAIDFYPSQQVPWPQ